MSTFLQICQAAQAECKIPGTAMSDTTSQQGELADIVRHVKNSYMELCGRNGGDWRWLRRRFTFNTVADDGNYSYTDVTDVDDSAVISRFGAWRMNDQRDPPKCYTTADGVGTQYWLNWIPWESWKGIYDIGTQTSGKPIHITVDPSNNIRVGPAPNAVYTITGDYERSPQILAADADVPDMPAQFHQMLVYLAMQRYGMSEHDTAIETMGVKLANPMIRQLEMNQMPVFRKAAPMA